MHPSIMLVGGQDLIASLVEPSIVTSQGYTSILLLHVLKHPIHIASTAVENIRARLGMQASAQTMPATHTHCSTHLQIYLDAHAK